jgi:hypothetical protein
MSIDLGNNPVGTPPTDEQKTQLRSSMGLGDADTVRFGALVLPAGTTAEIDSITNAVIGSFVFDIERKCFVEFTASDEYKIRTSSKVKTEDLSSATPISLSDSKLYESGLFEGTGTFTPIDTINHQSAAGDPLSDGFTSTYFYYTGAAAGGVGWRKAGESPLTIFDTTNLPTGALIRFVDNSELQKATFTYHSFIQSQTSEEPLLSFGVNQGTTYQFEINFGFVDIHGGNTTLYLSSSEALGEGRLNISLVDILGKQNVLDLNIEQLAQTDLFTFSSGSVLGVESPNFSKVILRGTIRATADATVSFGISQAISETNPILFEKASVIVTSLTE